jgi:hypothetical protein
MFSSILKCTHCNARCKIRCVETPGNVEVPQVFCGILWNGFVEGLDAQYPRLARTVLWGKAVAWMVIGAQTVGEPDRAQQAHQRQPRRRKKVRHRVACSLRLVAEHLGLSSLCCT